jgi:hypothetical protein
MTLRPTDQLQVANNPGLDQHSTGKRSAIPASIEISRQVKETVEPLLNQSNRSSWILLRCCYLLAGLTCLGLATAGAFLPVLPCTPFVLLAVYCFARSSSRLHGWLLRSKLFGGIIRDWQKHRAIRRSVRRSSVALILGVLSLSIALLQPGFYGALLIAGLVGIGLLVIFRLPVCD